MVRAFVEKCLSWRQGDLFAAPDLLDDRPFQHVDEGVRVVPIGPDSTAPGGYSTVSIDISFPGTWAEILLHDGDHNWLRWSGVRSRC